LACGDQRRLTGNGSALEVVPRRCAIQIHDFTFYQMALIFHKYPSFSPCHVLSRHIQPENENAAFRK